MDKYKIIALYGKSASGKDTFLKIALKCFKDFHKIINSTTRPPREGEKDGVAYHFLTNEEFTMQVLNCDMFEAANFRGWYYGTNINDLDKNKINIGVFNTVSLDIILKDDRFKVIPIYISTKPKTALIRALKREESPDVDEIIRRYQTDKKDFEIFFDEHPTLPNYYLLNEEEDSLSNERVSTYLNVVLTLENWDEIK